VGAGTSAITQLAVCGVGTVLYGQGAASDPVCSSVITLGLAGVGTGSLGFVGTTSGQVTVQSQAVAGTYNFNLPTTAGKRWGSIDQRRRGVRPAEDVDALLGDECANDHLSGSRSRLRLL